MNDLKFAFRQLLKNPGFTAVAVLTLALGIGANTAVFSYVDHLLIRALPVQDPGHLVTIATQLEHGRNENFHYPFYEALRDGNQVFEGLIASCDAPLNLTVNGQAERVQGMVVSGNYFPVLGVEAALGRTFAPDGDRAPGSEAAAILSHGFWMRRFAGDPGVIGRDVSINARRFTIIGVAPAEFTGTIPVVQPDIYVPIGMYPRIAPGVGLGNPLESRFLMWLGLLGRLKPGVTREQAQASLRVLAEQIKRQNPENVETAIVLSNGARGHTADLADARLPLTMVQVIVGLLLGIACANVANLLLARASTRRREIAIRRSVGATPGRVVRQLMLESLLLSVLGGGAGLWIAHGLNRMIAVFQPPGALNALEVPLDGRVFGFALFVSLLTGLVFGVAPSCQSARTELLPNLKDGAGGERGTPGRRMLRNALVAVQAALSVVVLIAAGLCVRSVQKLNAMDP
jgi:predicted permease